MSFPASVALWQAAALSPVDFLTKVELLDHEGNVRSQWLGYSAEGRYPTRAWDAGDIVRDTAWLPVGGLDAGSYRLELALLATTLADQAAQSAARRRRGAHGAV